MSRTGRAAGRRGFTLIEAMLVVCAVGIVPALMLPAVAGSRRVARRIACANRLKQIGIALAHHHDTFEALPAG